MNARAGGSESESEADYARAIELSRARGGRGVVLTDVRDADGEQVAEQLRAAGRHALYLHLDVTDESGWAAVVDSTQIGRAHV